MKTGVTFKIFVGFLVTHELETHLQKSPLFKKNAILPPKEKRSLKKIPFENKEYIGNYIEHSKLTLNDLPSIENELRDHLHELCPDFKHEKHQVKVFSQALIH